MLWALSGGRPISRIVQIGRLIRTDPLYRQTAVGIGFGLLIAIVLSRALTGTVPRPSGPGAPELVLAPSVAAAPSGGVAGATASGDSGLDPGSQRQPHAGRHESGGASRHDPPARHPAALRPAAPRAGGTPAGPGTGPGAPSRHLADGDSGRHPDGPAGRGCDPTPDPSADSGADSSGDGGPDPQSDDRSDRSSVDTSTDARPDAAAGAATTSDAGTDPAAGRVPHRSADPPADLPSLRHPLPQRSAYHPSTMARPTDLPPNVRRLVDEIESEIGETSVAIDDITGSRGRDHDGETPSDNGRVEDAVHRILEEIGEDPDRQGLVGTPERVHRMYTELTAGYHVDPERLINNAIFDVDYSEMVIVKDIPFYSLCEHHLLPFFGTAAVAYIPRGRVIGLSKIPRIVEMYARRLQVQERLTQQIAEFLQDRLEPQGVGVVIEATHLCAVMRGVRKPGTIMTTSSVLGLFRTRDRTRAEFLDHLARRTPIPG